MNNQKLLCLAILSILATPEVHGMHLGASTATATAPVSNVVVCTKKEAQNKALLPKELEELCMTGKLTQEGITQYLAQGGNIETPTIHGRTFLYWGAGYGDHELVRFLLDRNANIESRASNGETPLLAAIENQWQYTHSNMPAIQILVDAGANVNAVKENGETIDNIIDRTIRRAGIYRKAKSTQAEALYYYRPEEDGIAARAYIKDFLKRTKEKTNEALNCVVGIEASPIQLALEELICGPTEKEDKEIETLKAAIVRSTKIVFANNKQKNEKIGVVRADIKNILNSNPALLEKADETGYTPMNFAQFLGAVHAMEELNLFRNKQLEKAQKAREKIENELAAKKEALRSAITSPEPWINYRWKLIEAHIDENTMNARYDNNKTPLMLAAEVGDFMAVDSLLKKGANPTLRDGDFDSALWYGTKHGHYIVVKCLLDTIKAEPTILSQLDTEIQQCYKRAAEKENDAKNAEKKNCYRITKDFLKPYVKTEPIAQTSAK